MVRSDSHVEASGKSRTSAECTGTSAVGPAPSFQQTLRGVRCYHAGDLRRGAESGGGGARDLRLRGGAACLRELARTRQPNLPRVHAEGLPRVRQGVTRASHRIFVGQTEGQLPVAQSGADDLSVCLAEVPGAGRTAQAEVGLLGNSGDTTRQGEVVCRRPTFS